MHRAPWEIVQRGNTVHYRRQCGWNIRVGRVSPVLFALGNVTVDLCVKCLCHLGRGTAEFDEAPSLRHPVHAKTMTAQPGGDGFNVLRGWTKLLAEFLWGEPTAIAGRSRVLLRSQKLLK